MQKVVEANNIIFIAGSWLDKLDRTCNEYRAKLRIAGFICFRLFVSFCVPLQI